MLNQKIKAEREQIKIKCPQQKYHARYQEWLQEQANQNNEAALAELRRQRDNAPAQEQVEEKPENNIAREENSIEGIDIAARFRKRLEEEADNAPIIPKLRSR